MTGKLLWTVNRSFDACVDKSSEYSIHDMNVTLYGRTFNFHKVVRQQNSGAVEDFILPYSAVYLRIQKWKNYWNRSTFAKVIVKIKVAPFLMAHGVVSSNNTVHSWSGNAIYHFVRNCTDAFQWNINPQILTNVQEVGMPGLKTEPKYSNIIYTCNT